MIKKMIENNLTLDPVITKALQDIEMLTGVSINAQINVALKINIRLATLDPNIQKEIFKLLDMSDFLDMSD